MQKQLSMFDTLQPLDTAPNTLKPGDFVKLLRKTPHAAYWKKGEIVQVEVVHPTNGSVKFWNERANDWAYLHPGDMTKTSPPIDVLPPVAIVFGTESIEPIALCTESNCLHSQTHTVPGIALGTESNCLHGQIDSVPTEPIALGTESEPAPEVIDSAPSPVNRYRPKGTARGGEYYRFSYRAGDKKKNVHIPGGNTGSVLAQSRAAEVMELSAAGVPAVEICDRIKSWSGRVTW